MESVEASFLETLMADLENDKLVLPTLPEVALKVRDTLEDDDASMIDVAKVITTDTALSARLIQVSNSPLLRASRQIETVEAAVTRNRRTAAMALCAHPLVADAELSEILVKEIENDHGIQFSED